MATATTTDIKAAAAGSSPKTATADSSKLTEVKLANLAAAVKTARERLGAGQYKGIIDITTKKGQVSQNKAGTTYYMKPVILSGVGNQYFGIEIASLAKAHKFTDYGKPTLRNKGQVRALLKDQDIDDTKLMFELISIISQAFPKVIEEYEANLATLPEALADIFKLNPVKTIFVPYVSNKMGDEGVKFSMTLPLPGETVKVGKGEKIYTKISGEGVVGTDVNAETVAKVILSGTLAHMPKLSFDVNRSPQGWSLNIQCTGMNIVMKGENDEGGAASASRAAEKHASYLAKETSKRRARAAALGTGGAGGGDSAPIPTPSAASMDPTGAKSKSKTGTSTKRDTAVDAAAAALGDMKITGGGGGASSTNGGAVRANGNRAKVAPPKDDDDEGDGGEGDDE